MKRTIWTNQDYDEWVKAMVADGEDEDELTYERYHDDCDVFLGDERCNLDVEVDGVIVVFASLGLWNGRRNGFGFVGSNVKDILFSDCDYCTWYCDRYNVLFDGVHHDGSNHYLYRVAPNRYAAERLQERVIRGDLTREQFMRATKSLRPYVSKVYGWG